MLLKSGGTPVQPNQAMQAKKSEKRTLARDTRPVFWHIFCFKERWYVALQTVFRFLGAPSLSRATDMSIYRHPGFGMGLFVETLR
jgi:hypothetical protein